jgi:hypothetical protein
MHCARRAAGSDTGPFIALRIWAEDTHLVYHLGLINHQRMNDEFPEVVQQLPNYEVYGRVIIGGAPIAPIRSSMTHLLRS